jgi:hypothetical protein
MTLEGTSALALYRRLEAGWIHYLEIAIGSLLVCLDSMLKLIIKAERSA